MTILALTRRVSIARSIGVQSGQRIDGNQEFIGQGLSNIAGSFLLRLPIERLVQPQRRELRSRRAHTAGVRLLALFLVAIVLLVAPLAAYLPIAVMAAILFLVAWGLIDVSADPARIRAPAGAKARSCCVPSSPTLTRRARVRHLRSACCSRLLVYLQPHDRGRILE